MDIANYARNVWGRGERDVAKIAHDYLTEALASDDPFEALQFAVLTAVSDECRKLRRGLENSAPMWDSDPRIPSLITGRSHAVLDKRAQLLREQVFVPGKGMIRWEDLTIDDIDATIADYGKVIRGLEEKIARLESARRVMEKYKVTRLGDAPWEEITGTAGSKPKQGSKQTQPAA